jgi:methylated-DNA-[protein]-cysteine S-methyltransferase
MKRITETTWTGSLGESPLGPVTFTITMQGLAHVRFGDLAEFEPSGLAQGEALPVPQRDLLAEIKSQLAAYFSGKLQLFDIPVDWGALSAFQQRALKAAQEIPYGQVKSYARLANDIGQPDATRAVGGAMARNPMPVIVPCHRVVADDGRLTGYSGSGGLATKAWLLRLEGNDVSGERVVIG